MKASIRKSPRHTFTLLLVILFWGNLRAQAPGGVSSRLKLWLKADTATGTTTNNTAVSTWSDVSGRGFQATQSTSGSQPSFRNNSKDNVNFNPVVYFDGNDGLNVPYDTAWNSSINYFSFHAMDASTMPSPVLIGVPSSWLFTQNGAGNIRGLNIGGNNIYNAGYVVGQKEILSFSFKKGTGLSTDIKIDGVGNTNVWGSGAYSYNINNTTNPLNIGYYGGRFWIGPIGEQIIYDTTLSALDRQKIHSYLAVKYGQTLVNQNYLATDGSVIWNSNLNRTYKSNIAGIGRDDAEGLNQKQSMATNLKDFQVVIGNGGLANSNKLNTNNFSADKSYLTWGDNNGSVSFVKAISINVPSGLSRAARMSRVWKVQESGTVGTVTIAIPDSMFNLTTFLVCSSDSSFSSSCTWASMSTTTINGVLYRTATFDFSSGQFFTFASQIVSPGGLPDVAFWIKADDKYNTTLSDGVSLTKWINFGSVGKSLGVLGSATGNRYRINNTATFNYNPYVDFNETGGFQISNDSSWNKDVTVFSVNLVNNSVSHKSIISSMSASAGWWSYCSHPNSWAPYARTLSTKTGSLITPSEIMNPGEVELTGFDMKLGMPGNMNLYANGRTSLSGSANYLKNSTSILAVGSYSEWGGWFMNGSIAEQVIFPGVLSTKQRQMVNTYLGIKYGLSLQHNYLSSDSNAIVWNYTANSNFKYNIAGIGRDDNSGLNQKQSKSSSPGYQVEMALNQFAVNNLSNSNAFLSDKTFFLWGDNGLSSGFSVSVSANKPGGLGNMARMSKVWKTQLTGTIDSVTLMINRQAFTGKSKYLLLSADSTFSSSVTWMNLSEVSFNSITYLSKRLLPASLQYFTFASEAIFPGGVEGAAVWLKANDSALLGLSDSSAIVSWTNNGTKGGDANGDIVRAPRYRNNFAENINFNPVLSFNGTNNYFKINNGIFGSATFSSASMFAVNTIRTVKNCNLAYEVLSTGGFSMQPVLGSGYATWAAQSTSQIAALWGGLLKTPYLWTGYNNNSKSPKNEFFRNGTLIGSNNTTTSITGNNNPLFIGASAIASNNMDGNIGEIIIYQDALTAVQKQKIETYLAIKYGTSISQTLATDYLSTNGTKIWNANLNRTYSNNITGIGRDDNEGLYQKQSVNAQPGMNVVIGLNAIKSDNLSNKGVFTNDNTYFIWGNNSAGPVYTVSITNNMPSTVSNVQRMARVWKVQSTGTVDTVQLALLATYIPGKNKYLVVSNDSSFNSGNVWYKLDSIVINNANYYSSRLVLNNGQFFTFVGASLKPGGVSRASVWLRADDLVNTAFTNNTAMSAWNNQSGSDNATQSTSSKYPTYRNNSNDNINFNAIVNFDGGDDVLTIPYNVNNNRSTTVFSVYKQSSPQVNRVPIGSSSGFTGWNLVLQSNTSRQLNSGTGSAWSQLVGSNYTATRPEVLSFSLDSGTSKKASLFVNHLQVASTTTGTYIGNTSGVLGIGGLASSNYFNGAIAEQIVFDTVISAIERQSVGTYLAIKYGLGMDQTSATHYIATDGSTIVWNANKNRSFRFNIAGIGRDDKEGLNQKQSISLSSGRQVFMALGSVATDNKSNSSTFTNDLSYMVWGDNNLSMNFDEPITSNLPSGISNVSRMKRVWKLEKTGALGAVQIGIPGTYSTNATKYLVVSNDSSFNSGCVWYALTYTTLNAVQYWTANVNFNSGQFFTFVGVETGPGGVKGASLWLKSDDILYASTHTLAASNNNAAMPYWTNYGSGSDAYQTNLASQPRFTYTGPTLINFLPNVLFGSPYSFRIDGDLGLTGQQATAFSVNKNLGGVGFMLQPNTALTNGMTLSSGTPGNSTFGLLSSTTASGTNSNSGAVAITGGRRYNSSLTASVNGNDLNTASNSSDFASANGFILNSNASGTYLGANNRTAEVIVYPFTLTSNQNRQVNSYLAIKYGITLDQSVTGQHYLSSDSNQIIWHAVKNSKFNKHVAGIGRDDQSSLDQRISMSQDTGSHIFVSYNTGVFGTNLLSNAPFANDKQYLIWGDNDSSMTIGVTAVSGKRMSRVWKVQNTGSVATVRTGLPATVFSNNVTNKYLIVSSDSTFKSTFKRYLLGGLNINGVVYYSATAQINDGEFFTFADLNCNYPELSTPAVRTLANAGYCNINGWLYYKDPSNASQSLVAIHPNGNTWNPDSIILDVSNPLPHIQSDGTNITALYPRMLTIVAPGTYTVNGGIKVKFFYDENEFSSLPNTTRNWFKHKGRKWDVLKDLHPMVLDSCIILEPDSIGMEGHLNFAEFHGITSFSTFGYGGTTRLNALPLKLLSFDALPVDNISNLSWKVNWEHTELVKFVIERSKDGFGWTEFMTIDTTFNAGIIEFNTIDYLPYKPFTFYRIKVVPVSGGVFYSNRIKVEFEQVANQTMIYPNPSTGTIAVNLSSDLSSGTIQVMDMDGKILLSKTYFEEDGVMLDLKDFKAGMYFIRVFNEFSQFSDKVLILSN